MNRIRQVILEKAPFLSTYSDKNQRKISDHRPWKAPQVAHGDHCPHREAITATLWWPPQTVEHAKGG